MIVKICGLTNVHDALAAYHAGADMIGMVFAESSRRVPIRTACTIAKEVGAPALKVGIFVDEELPVVIETASAVGLDLVQLHGRETPEYCGMFTTTPFKTIKAFRVRGEVDITRISPYRDCVDYILVDSYHPRTAGGTGQTFDWSLTGGLHSVSIPWILAGGLCPENVAEAVRLCRPDGIDVSGGVESKPGKKDHQLMSDFIKHARGGSGG